MIPPFHGQELARNFSGNDRNVIKEFRRGVGDSVPKIRLGNQINPARE